MRNKKLKTMEISRDDVYSFLFSTMIETLAEGLDYDEDAKKSFSKIEFDAINNDFVLYGNLFGNLYIDKIISKLDNLVSEEKQGKESEK